MTEREDFSRIVKTAFVASMIGASLFVVAIMLLAAVPAKSGAQVNTAILFALFGFPYGWVIAALTAWPIGTLIGWLLNRTGPSTTARAAAGGGLTGFVLTAPILVIGGRFPLEVTPAEWLIVTGFTVLGSVSGWLAYRWMLRRRLPA